MARSQYRAMSYGFSAASVATERNVQCESRGSESDIDCRVKLDWPRWEQLTDVTDDITLSRSEINRQWRKTWLDIDIV